MNKRTIVLAMTGAAAVWLGWVQFSKRAPGENERELRPSPIPQHDVIRVQTSPVILELERRLEPKIKMPDWELQRMQDRERNFFEWRDARLGIRAVDGSNALVF